MKAEILSILKQSDSYVSGQFLCNKLGVSRTAIWKVMNQLKEYGYEIESIPHQGYRLLSYPDVVTSVEIRSILKTKTMGKKVLFFEELDSTNTKAKEVAEQKETHGTLIVTEKQLFGKGRRGKNWSSPSLGGIWMTLILKPQIQPKSASMLTLVMALAVVKAIQKNGIDAYIKWPNDIVINGKKVCGILTEMSSELDYINHVVIGAGINVNMKEFPEEIKEVATSLWMEGLHEIKRSEMIAEILTQFELCYEEFIKTETLEFFQKEYNQCLINHKKEVKIIENGKEYFGIAQGITNTGELIVELQDGSKKEVIAGEVSVRGVYGYTI